MTPVDVHLDVMPLSTAGVSVWETLPPDANGFSDAEQLAPEAEVPVLGGGVDVGFGWFGESRSRLLASGALNVWGAAWDLGFEHVARSWTADIDVGVRWCFGKKDRLESPVLLDVGAGLRFVTLSQSWWEDHTKYGVGGHGAIAYRIGKGRLRGLLGARADLTVVPTSVTGFLHGDREIDWTWTPSSFHGGLFVGGEWE